MATYTELRNLFGNSDLLNRTAVAVIVAAQGILEETTPSVERKAWAARAFASPEKEAKRVLMAVLADNRSIVVDNITGVTDSTLQTGVSAAVDLFIDADAGV